MSISKSLFIPILIFVAVILIGASVYHYVEKWNYIDSFYFTVITVTTIGYGDFAPQTDAGKIFTMFFAFAGIGLVFYFISLVGRYMFRKQLRGRLREAGRISGERGVRRIKRR